MCEGAAPEVGILDDGVGAVSLLGVEHAQWEVGEHGVVAVVGEQLALPVRDRYFGVRDQPLFVVVPDRAAVTGADRGVETMAIKALSSLTPVECACVRYRRAAVPS